MVLPGISTKNGLASVSDSIRNDMHKISLRTLGIYVFFAIIPLFLTGCSRISLPTDPSTTASTDPSTTASTDPNNVPSNVTIAAGLPSFFIKADGTLWAWGWNLFGQLGIGSTNPQLSPVQVGTETNWASLATGYYHAVAVKTDGTLWTWGRNYAGVLGTSTTETCYTDMVPIYDSTYPCSTVPLQVGTETDWLAVVAGEFNSAAIKTDGTLWIWGWGWQGVIGNSSFEDANWPVQVEPGTQWKNVAIGDYHVLAIKTDGTLWAWGLNYFGQVGVGTNLVQYTTPMQVGTDNDWVSVSGGSYHTLALKIDGTLWAWGLNSSGQVGTITSEQCSGDNYPCSTVPLQIAGTDWAAITTGDSSSYAIKKDGTLWAWGSNLFGQLGDGSTTDHDTPIQVGTEKNWTKVAAGKHHVLAIKTDGSVWACGENYYGNLGDGDTNSSNVFLPVTFITP